MMNLRSLRRRRCGVLLALFLICSLAVGCGKPDGTITGKISYRGKPLTAGHVTFTPENGPAVNGEIDKDGTYRAEKVLVGKARISVQAGVGMNRDGIAKVSDPRKPKEMMEAFKAKNTERIPQKYNTPDSSDLTYEVKTGTQEHDIELK